MRNVWIVVACVVFFALLGVASAFHKEDSYQPSFVGKRYVVQSEASPPLDLVGNDWFPSSEYAGKDVQFGVNKFISGRSYSISDIGIDETQDPWNYVNGEWFTWESADGVTYSVRMRDGQYTAYKMNNVWKPVEMMYTPTYGLGISRIIELYILNGILNTEIMPFVDIVNRHIKYFAKETKPNDFYLAKNEFKDERELALMVPQETTKVITQTKPVVYGTKIGDTAPNFKMGLLDVREVWLSDYYGRKTIVNIWATWCGKCILEFPIINEANAENKGVNVLAVCSDGNINQIKRIKDKYSSRYACDFTMASSIGVDKVFGLFGVPTTYFLDEYGTIKYIKVGVFDSYQEIENILESY